METFNTQQLVIISILECWRAANNSITLFQWSVDSYIYAEADVILAICLDLRGCYLHVPILALLFFDSQLSQRLFGFFALRQLLGNILKIEAALILIYHLPLQV